MEKSSSCSRLSHRGTAELVERWRGWWSFWIKKTSFPISTALPNKCGISFNSTIILSWCQLLFQSSITPHNALCFLSPLPVGWLVTRGVHALRSSPFLPAYGNILLVPSFFAGLKHLPRGILPSNHTISSHQLWLQTTVTAQHTPWHKERNSTFSHSLLRWASLSEKSKTVFSFRCCLVLSLNLKHVRNDVRDKPEFLGKGTHEIPAVWRVQCQPLRPRAKYSSCY